MIPKVVKRKTGDNFGRLAEYIAAAKDKGEKLDQFWMVNCLAGETKDDLDLAITEIENKQARNVQTKADKTYHLVVSFRDEKPSPEALNNIEREYAKALGFEDHQRIVATHQNTDNFHMHIAYNRIHPQTLKNHAPARDYAVLEKTSRAMEKKYGLKVDLGKEDKVKDKSQEQEKTQISSKAKDFEAKTWEQSFDSFTHVHKQALLELREKAKSWEDIHQGFAEYGMTIQVRANGLSIKDIQSKAAMKASSLDRSYSKGAMEQKFGAFKSPEKPLTKTRKSHYSRKPVTKFARQSNAWKKYLGHIKRKETLVVEGLRNWKDYLSYEAMSDPLAAAIIGHHKKLMKLTETILDPQGGKSPFGKGKPAFLLVPLSGNKNGHVKIRDDNRLYLSALSEEKDLIRKLGGKWDNNAKSWYAPKGSDLETFAEWQNEDAVGPALELGEYQKILEKSRLYVTLSFKEREVARKLGGKWDNFVKSWYAPEGSELAIFAKWHNEETMGPSVTFKQFQAILAKDNLEKQASIYLAIGDEEQELATKLGGKWDEKVKSYYAPKGSDLETFARWQNQNIAGPMMPLAQFQRNLEKSRSYVKTQTTEHTLATKLGGKWDNFVKSFHAPKDSSLAIFAKWQKPELIGPSVNLHQFQTILENRRFYVAISFKEKELAQKLGGKWDDGVRSWYAPEGSDLELFANLQKDNSVGPPLPLVQFQKALENSRLYAEITFKDKALARELGGKWDQSAKSWHAPIGSKLALYAKWQKELPVGPSMPLQQYKELLKQSYIEKSGQRFVHITFTEKEAARKLGGKWDGAIKEWYAPKGSDLEKFAKGLDKDDIGPPLALKEYQKIVEKTRSEKKERERAAQELIKVAAIASTVWEKNETLATPKNSSYLKERGIKGFGIKVAEDGKLVIPLRNTEGKIQSLHTISENGTEFTEGTENKGHSLVIDPKQELLKASEKSVATIIISQEYAIGETLYEATRLPVIVALHNENILPVAKSIREQYPDAKIVISSNDTGEISDMKGLEKAEERRISEVALAVDGKILTPNFNASEKEKGLSNWNDLLIKRGSFRATQQIKSELKKLITPQVSKKKKQEMSL